MVRMSNIVVIGEREPACIKVGAGEDEAKRGVVKEAWLQFDDGGARVSQGGDVVPA